MALGAYIGLIAAGTHLAGTLFWASMLGNAAPLVFLLRSFPCPFHRERRGNHCGPALAVAAAQGLALALLGPRLFRRISTFLQILLVGLLVLCLSLAAGAE